MLTDIFREDRFGGLGAKLRGSRFRAVAPPRMRVIYVATAILLLFVLLGPLMTLNESGLTGEGSSIRQIGYLAAFGLAVVGSRPIANRTSLLVVPIPIVIALLWCWISLRWAIEPDIGMRRLFLTTLVIWTIFILVQSAGYRPMLTMIRIALVAALIGNYLTVYLFPQIGMHQPTAGATTALVGNWCGFMAHKNFAGAACALSVLCFLYDAKKIPWWIRLAVVVGGCYFLYKAQSKTSLGVGAISIVGGYVFQRYNPRYRLVLIPAIAIVGSFGWWAISTFNNVLRMNYLDPAAFTGRGLIWQMLLKYSADHPMGAGYGSFWNIGPSSPVYTYGQGFLQIVTVGHNGYLDLLVTIGMIGMLIAIFATLIWPIGKMLASKQIVAERGALIISIILFCMGHNITESSLLERDTLVGVFLMFANAFVARETKVRRRLSSVSGDQLLRELGNRRTDFTIQTPSRV